MKFVVLSFLTQTVNGLPKNFGCRWIVGTQPTTKFLSSAFFGHFSAWAAAFCASEYRDSKSDDDVFCNKALYASFFVRIASLTSWFYQSVLFSLLAVVLGRFCPELSTADEIIAVRNKDHSISMCSETSKSCQNFAAILDAICFLTSLSARASHLIL